MAFLRKDVVFHEETQRNRASYVYSCDECGSLLHRRRLEHHKSHFCNVECQKQSQRSGVLKDKKEAHFLEKYGVSNPYAAQSIIDKKKEKYKTTLGVDNPSKSDIVKAKKRETFLKHYGVANNFCRNEILKKAQDRCIELFGAPTPMQNQRINAQANGPDGIAKRFKTFKKNGTMKRSGPEKLLYSVLVDMFGADDVEHSVIVNGWSIDIYIKSNETFVQCDGVFWHGLTMDEATRKRYPSIDRKWVLDKLQIEWFRLNCKKLVRITDIEFLRAYEEECVEKLFLSKGLVLAANVERENSTFP